jgi:hypothetical protein
MSTVYYALVHNITWSVVLLGVEFIYNAMSNEKFS